MGSALRTLRKARNLTQASLAFQAGTIKNQIQLLEHGLVLVRKGDMRPSNPRITSLAAVLDVPASELFAEARL